MRDKLHKYLPAILADMLIKEGVEKALEIRLRAGQKAKLRFPDKSVKTDFDVTREVISDILQQLCEYSLYTYSEDIAKGFVSAGGWRVGIGGAVSFSGGVSKGIRNISSLDIRIAREIKGCADKLMKYIVCEDRVLGTLVASPPACGKTTVIRDIARQLSNRGHNIAVIDERGEIAALGGSGIPSFDLGENTDILSNVKKSTGAEMALRSLAPEVIVLDEIGSKNDMQAIYEAEAGGCAVLCTAHIYDIESLKNRKYIFPLIDDNVIERTIFLRGTGKISAVCGKKGEILWQDMQE